MNRPQRTTPFGPEDYLAWEREQTLKHEYVGGEVFAMGGASDAHVTTALNLASILRSQLRGTACRTYMADMKLAVDVANSFFYPDILVSCDARDRAPEASHVKRHPRLVVEVLSPSTEAYDRGNKFAAYRKLESLQEYVLISTGERRIDTFRRDATGHWVLYPVGAGDELELTSVDLRVAVDLVFEGVEAEADADGTQPAT